MGEDRQDRELILRLGLDSDPGRRRRQNEDAAGFREPDFPSVLASHGRLYLVADGVGGADSGEVASSLAVRVTLDSYYEQPESATPEARLRAAFHAANAAVYEESARTAGIRGMATTLVAALVVGESALIANVGDSRAYLVRAGGIRQLSRDHSLVARLVEEGNITAAEARTHPRRNVIMRSIGAEPTAFADTCLERLTPGDRLVLCSDGLDKHVEDPEIAELVTANAPDAAVRRLIALANERGGSDNITAAVILVEREGDARAVIGANNRRVRQRWQPRPVAGAAARRGPRWMWPAIAAAGVVLVVGAVGVALVGTPLGQQVGLPAGATPVGTAPAAASPSATPARGTPGVGGTAGELATATSSASPTASATPTATPTTTPTPAPEATKALAPPTATTTVQAGAPQVVPTPPNLAIPSQPTVVRGGTTDPQPDPGLNKTPGPSAPGR